MSLGTVLFKLGIGRYPGHAEDIARALVATAKNPAREGLGAAADLLERKAYGYKPRVGVRTEFHDLPRAITAQLDDAERSAMAGRTGGGKGLGGEDVEWVDLTTDNLGRSYKPGRADQIDKIARLLRRGERFSAENPFLANEPLIIGGATALGAAAFPQGWDHMSPLDKLKARFSGI